MEHTPGPWTVDDNYIKCRFDGRQNNVCRMLGRGDETEANAHLIAAAPDLREACEVAMKAFDDPDPISYRRAKAKCAAAIGKVNK